MKYWFVILLLIAGCSQPQPQPQPQPQQQPRQWRIDAVTPNGKTPVFWMVTSYEKPYPVYRSWGATCYRARGIEVPVGWMLLVREYSEEAPR